MVDGLFLLRENEVGLDEEKARSIWETWIGAMGIIVFPTGCQVVQASLDFFLTLWDLAPTLFFRF